MTKPKLSSVEREKAKHLEEACKKQADEICESMTDKATKFYAESKKTVADAQESIKEYTDNLVKHVREKPLSSLLIAGGIGFILSSLFKKR